MIDITLVVIIAFAVMAVLGFVRGIFKGTFRSLTDIGFVLVNAVLSVLISKGIAKLLAKPKTIYSLLVSLKGSIGSEGFSNFVDSLAPQLEEGGLLAGSAAGLILMLPAVILTPFIYLFVFMILGAIFKIVKLIVQKLLIPKTPSAPLRILGGALGSVRTVLAFALFLVPILGYANFAIDTMETANDISENNQAQVQVVEQKQMSQDIYIEDEVVVLTLENVPQKQEIVAQESPIVSTSGTVEMIKEPLRKGPLNAVRVCGGQWMFSILTTAKQDGVKLSLVDETENVMDIYSAISDIGSMDTGKMTDKELELIDNVVTELSESEYLTSLIASVLAEASTQLYEKGEILTFKLPSYGKSIDPVVKTFLQVWSTTDRAGLINDIRTYLEVFAHLVKHGVIGGNEEEPSTDAQLEKASNKSVNGELDEAAEKETEETKKEDNSFSKWENGALYGDILTTLYKNPRTRPTIPTIADAIQSYLYEIYETVNGKPYGEPTKVDMEGVKQEDMGLEGNRIGTAIKEIRIFSDTINGIENINDIIKAGDFGTLGHGLNQIRDSVFFSGSYRFLLDTLLNSEKCAKLGIFDSEFVAKATSPGADMEKMLLSRQNVALMTIAMWDHDKKGQEESLQVMINNIAHDDSDSLKELVTLENLDKYGVKGDQAGTISGIMNSLVDTVHMHDFVDENGNGSNEDEIEVESQKVSHILTVINGAYDNTTGAENVFGTENSKTGEDAGSLVDQIVDSEIATEMIQSAVSEGNDDPYNIQNALTGNDKASMEQALREKYSLAQTEEERATIKNTAVIFFGQNQTIIP